MVPANGLLRIFWPSDCARGKEEDGTLVGWRNSDLDFFVISVLSDVGPERAQKALQAGTLFRGCPHPMKQMYELCGSSSVQVLGTLNPQHLPQKFNSEHLVLISKGNGTLPVLHCPTEHEISAQIVLFNRPSPHRMQYMSLKPISLALGDKDDIGSPPTYDSDDGDAQTPAKHANLIEKLKLHTVVWHTTTQKEKMLPNILAQINCSAELDALISKNASVLKTRAKRTLSVGEKVVESAKTLKDYFIDLLWHIATEWAWPIITQVLIFALLCHRLAAEVVLRILAWRIRPEAAALKDMSATAQQVDIRLQQFCYWPIQYMTLRKRREGWESVTDRHPDYIRFYNSLWLVANDVIIGIAVGSFIIDNADMVALKINSILNAWTIEGLMDMISWLMDWPAGLKLNNELAVFLGGLVLFMVDYWRSWIVSLQPLLPAVIYVIGFASFAGATMPIAMFSDLLSLLTIHIYCFYTASARIFHWQLTIIMSLFHLFRGKKHNVLRNRIDSCDYDLDQLLLGTILFTLLFFLLPTIAVFYLTFTSARMAVIFLKAAQDTLLACLNHFPLFALMLRIKDPSRLPGGISFQLIDTPSPQAPPTTTKENSIPTSYIHLHSVPLSLRAMLAQYFQLATRIRRHYLAPHVLFRLLTGRLLPPIHRKSMYSLQYSMLPAQRASVLQVWQALTEAGSREAYFAGKPGPPPRPLGIVTNGKGHGSVGKGGGVNGVLVGHKAWKGRS